MKKELMIAIILAMILITSSAGLASVANPPVDAPAGEGTGAAAPPAAEEHKTKEGAPPPAPAAAGKEAPAAEMPKAGAPAAGAKQPAASEEKKNKETAATERQSYIKALESDIARLNTQIPAKQNEYNKEEDAKKKLELEKELKNLRKQRDHKTSELVRMSPTSLGEIIDYVFLAVIVYPFRIVQGYEEYKGIGKWSSLWVSDEDMAKKRQETAQKFCDEILGGAFGGKNCYQSKICEKLYPIDPPQAQNFLVTEISVGGHTPAASIQAEKSLPINYAEAGKTKTKRVYKITYFIENPHMDQELTYYIELRGDKTFKSEESRLTGRKLERGREIAGEREGRLGSDPMIFESDSNYDNACLVFSPRIMNSRGGYTNEICAPIIQYSGAATRPYTLPPATQTAVQNATGTSTGVSMTGA